MVSSVVNIITKHLNLNDVEPQEGAFLALDTTIPNQMLTLSKLKFQLEQQIEHHSRIRHLQCLSTLILELAL